MYDATAENTTTTLNALQATQLFGAMSETASYQLFAASQKITMDKDSLLYLQGDNPEWFYLVLSGWVKVFRETFDGDEAIIELVGAGQFVGECTPLEGNTHTCSAAVADKAVLIRLPISLLGAAIKEDHKFALAMLENVAKKRLSQMKEIEGLKLQKADQRIGCFLLQQCNGQPSGERDLTLPYGKSLIATQLGMQGETFSRAIKKLRNATDVQVTKNKVTVPDLKKLSEFVCAGCSNQYPCKTPESDKA